MVVDNVVAAGSDDSCMRHQRSRAKYLVARSREQTNSIFDYVHLSTSLLRKVRFGQPIELAIQPPAQSKRQQTPAPLDARTLSDLNTANAARKKQQQSNHQRTRPSATAVAAAATASSSSSKYRNQRQPRPAVHQPFIQYNRVVRFEAADGGFLLVERDGCVRKVPSEYAGDPRTLVTLVARAPVATIAMQPTRVRSGDCAFIVQSGRASLPTKPKTKHSAVRADSDEMLEGPAWLVDDVVRHDRVAAAAQHDCMAHSAPSRRTKQSIRKQQLAQALAVAAAPEVDAMPTTVWYLLKVGGDNTHFRDGDRCQLVQNRSVVCYELETSTSAAAVGSSQSLRSKQTVASSARPSAQPATFSHVWLHDTATTHSAITTPYHPTQCQCSTQPTATTSNSTRTWDNTWRICDVDGHDRRTGSRAALPTVTLHQAIRHRPSWSITGNSTAALAASSTALLAADHGCSDSDSDSDGSVDDCDQHSQDVLHRQQSVYDIATFAVKAEARQTHAARIIVRFFQCVVRADATQSRVQAFLQRRRRLAHPERDVTTQLSDAEQLRLLQSYNPHVYGSGTNALRLRTASRSPQRTRRDVAINRFTSSIESDRQRLAALKSGVEYLSRDWLRTERHTLQPHCAAASRCGSMYSHHRPLSSPMTPARIAATREREREFAVGMKMATCDAPTFRFGAAAATRIRPHTAPFGMSTNLQPAPK